MYTHCNVCGRETNSAGNCPSVHYITDAEFAAYMQKRGHQIDALRGMGDWDHPTEKEWTAAMQLAQAECARLRARCARLEGAILEIRELIAGVSCDAKFSQECRACGLSDIVNFTLEGK